MEQNCQGKPAAKKKPQTGKIVKQLCEVTKEFVVVVLAFQSL